MVAIFSRTGRNIIILHYVLNLPATKRTVPMSPHIGFVSADAGMSLLTEDHIRDTTQQWLMTHRRHTAAESSELGLRLMMIFLTDNSLRKGSKVLIILQLELVHVWHFD